MRIQTWGILLLSITAHAATATDFELMEIQQCLDAGNPWDCVSLSEMDVNLCPVEALEQDLMIAIGTLLATGECPDDAGSPCAVTCATLGITGVDPEESRIEPMPIIRLDHTFSRVRTAGLYAATQLDTRRYKTVRYVRLLDNLQDLSCDIEGGALVDLNGNGENDLVAGAPDCGSSGAGRVYVYLDIGEGDVRATSYDVAIDGVSGQHLGSRFATSGLSGEDEVLVGFPGSSTSAYSLDSTTFSTSKTSITSYSRTTLRWDDLFYWNDNL